MKLTDINKIPKKVDESSRHELEEKGYSISLSYGFPMHQPSIIINIDYRKITDLLKPSKDMIWDNDQYMRVRKLARELGQEDLIDNLRSESLNLPMEQKTSEKISQLTNSFMTMILNMFLADKQIVEQAFNNELNSIEQQLNAMVSQKAPE